MLLALCCGLTACASYPERTAEAYGAFESGRLADAAKLYADPDTTGSEFLGGAEAGSVALAAGDWEGAIQHLGRAAASVQEYEDRALVSPTSAGESLLTWTINEGMAGYRGEGFERVMLHASLGLAYLGRGDFDGAGVEARRANKLLESEEALYEKEYAAGGLGHFLSALVYEMQGQPDNAYIDYKRMLAKGVGVQFAGRAALRLSKRLAFQDEHEQWRERFGAGFEGPEPPDGAATIVVVAGVGAGPYKEAITIPIPTPTGLLQWSVPTLVARSQSVQALEFGIAGQAGRVSTDVVEDVYTVTKENLEDRIAWLAAKSAVRAFLKRELTQQLDKQSPVLGAIAGTVFTLVTEHADLRTWQTLPNTWQVARAFVAPGEHSLELSAVGGESVALGRFELERGETLFVIARTLGTRLSAHVVGGKRLDLAPEVEASSTQAAAQGALPGESSEPSRQNP